MDILQQKRLLKFGAVPFTTNVLEGALGADEECRL